jgi:hypothetical protein
MRDQFAEVTSKCQAGSPVRQNTLFTHVPVLQR